jgi:chitin disaccharide deacetylase
MIILNADDYAMTKGISRAILELASARRLSATSALVTSSWWADDAPGLAKLRGTLAIGLHLNLTLGAPLGPMTGIAPDGKFPSLKRLLLRSLARRLDALEIGAEICRQLDRFERVLGFPPDHVDGHQHVQVLPVIRQALIAELSRRFPRGGPLVRDPSDRLGVIIRRHGGRIKALSVNVLALGFAKLARMAGFATNDGFSGFSEFNTAGSYAAELSSHMKEIGRCHIIMCHPGYPDAELAALDPVVARRGQEFETLLQTSELTGRIWRPERPNDGATVDWRLLASSA